MVETKCKVDFNNHDLGGWGKRIQNADPALVKPSGHPPSEITVKNLGGGWECRDKIAGLGGAVGTSRR